MVMNFLKKNKNKSEEVEQYYGVGGFLFEIVKIFVLALVIIVPIRMFLFQPFFVQGSSMEPNFSDGQYLIVNEVGYKKTKVKLGKFNFFTVNSSKSFERGDVVVFRYPLNPKQFFIKRIIGLGGEKVKIEKGTVRIYNEQNPEGIKLKEEYLPAGLITKNDMIYKLKEDEYFVMGDNRNFSRDSRAWGSIDTDDVIGKVLLRAWPINKIKIFK